MTFLLRKTPKQGEGGFTVFEVLAAFVLLSLFLSRFIPALVQVNAAKLQAEKRMEAYLLGYGKLQEVLCHAERGLAGHLAGARYNYEWSLQEEKKAGLLTRALTIKWKDLGYERKVQLHKIQVKEE